MIEPHHYPTLPIPQELVRGCLLGYILQCSFWFLTWPFFNALEALRLVSLPCVGQGLSLGLIDGGEPLWSPWLAIIYLRLLRPSMMLHRDLTYPMCLLQVIPWNFSSCLYTSWKHLPIIYYKILSLKITWKLFYNK